MNKRKNGKKLPVTLNESEVELLRNCCTRSATGRRNRAIMEAMLCAGLRVSEVIALNPADIDWNGGMIRVNNGKGGRDRVIPVNDETIAHLRVWHSLRTSKGLNGRHAFFCGIRTKGKRLTARSVQDMIKGHAKRAGIEKNVSPHVLRHTYATNLLDNGFSIREVQELLGHSDVSTTMVYTHVNPEALRRKIQNGSREKDDKVAELQEQLAAIQAELEKLGGK